MTKTDVEFLVCANSFFTAAAPDAGAYYVKGQTYRSDEPGVLVHPEWFLHPLEATSANMTKVGARDIAENYERSEAIRQKTEAAMRPKPPQVFQEWEMLICTKQLGVETHGGRAPSRLVLIGTVAPPDSPWVKVAPKNWRCVLPKGAKVGDCVVCTETHGTGRTRLYQGEFVRREDERVAINPHCFREPRSVPGGGGLKTWPMGGGYVTEGS